MSCFFCIHLKLVFLTQLPASQQCLNMEKNPFVNPLSPHDALKHHFTTLKTDNFPTIDGFIMKISMKLVYQYMAIFFTFSLTSNHLHPLQVENCDSNSRLVVDEEDNGKFRLERVNSSGWFVCRVSSHVLYVKNKTQRESLIKSCQSGIY